MFAGGTSVSVGAGLTAEGIDVSVAGTNVAVETGPQPPNKNANATRTVILIYCLNMDIFLSQKVRDGTHNLTLPAAVQFQLASRSTKPSSRLRNSSPYSVSNNSVPWTVPGKNLSCLGSGESSNICFICGITDE